MSETYYLVSGGFDPLHEGHISLIRAAAQKSDGVIILLNSDDWLVRKKGKNFMGANTRKIICENIKNVVDVLEFDDSDNSACGGIIKARAKYPDAVLIFANGGDRTKDNIPEIPCCKEQNVILEFGVGGENKANSSSWILKTFQTGFANNYQNKSSAQRIWGKWQVLDNGANYTVKVINILPKSGLSMQEHQHRSEHWVVVSGNAQVILDGNLIELPTFSHVNIPKGARHKLINNSNLPATIIETQFGNILDEKDIKRFD